MHLHLFFTLHGVVQHDSGYHLREVFRKLSNSVHKTPCLVSQWPNAACGQSNNLMRYENQSAYHGDPWLAFPRLYVYVNDLARSLTLAHKAHTHRPWVRWTPHPSPWNLAPPADWSNRCNNVVVPEIQPRSWYKYKYCPLAMAGQTLCWQPRPVFLCQCWAGADSQNWPVVKSGGFQMLKTLYNQEQLVGFQHWLNTITQRESMEQSISC